MARSGCVYLAVNTVNGKKYVGQTNTTLDGRRRGHLAAAIRRGSTKPFHAALRKYGSKAFTWLVLHYSTGLAERYTIEGLFVRALATKAPNGYNLTDRGPGIVGRKLSRAEVETRRVRATGRKHRPLAKLKIGIAAKKRLASAEARKAHSTRLREAMNRPDVLKKISKASAERKHTEKTRQRISNSLKVANADPAVRRSHGRKGRSKSPEHRAKIAAATRQQWADKEGRAKLMARHTK